MGQLLYIGAPFPFMLCYYALGGYLGRHMPRIRFSILLAFFIITLLLAYAEHMYLLTEYGYYSAVRPVNRIFCLASVLLLFSEPVSMAFRKMSDNRVVKVIVYLGRISFGVYLTHILCIMAFDCFLPSVSGSWALSWLAVTTVTSLVISLLNVALPKKISHLLGLTQ